jgi:hypothetical protein
MRARFGLIASILLGSSLVIWFHLLKFFNCFVFMPFDWEATDGDHLNLILRIQKGLPIYTDWKKGAVLNIYCPGYHYFVALLGLIFPTGLVLARSVSLVSFFGSVGLIFFSVFTSKRPDENRREKYLIAALTAVSITAIFFERILSDLVDLNPNAFYTFLCLASVFVLALWIEKKSQQLLLLSAVLAFMAVFTKQQGIWAFGTGLIALVFSSRKKSEWLAYVGLFLVLSVGATLYLEAVNDHSFLSSTVFNLSKIYFSPLFAAAKRIGIFFIQNVQWFVIWEAGLIYSWRKRRLRIWHVSIPIQIVLLFLTVGNEAGGPNYFYSLWISLLICSGISVLDFMTDQAWMSIMGLRLAAGFVCVFLAVQAMFAASFNSRELDKLTAGSIGIETIMKGYYSEVTRLMSASSNKEVLIDRSAGAFIVAGGRLDNEFCAMSHAWVSSDPDFNRDAFLEKIRQKKFAFITTGLEPFQLPIAQALQQFYKPLEDMRVNLWKGQTLDNVLIFVPR